MPIKAQNKDRYPTGWKAISARIRFERAKGRCECRGECGHNHPEYYCSKKRRRERQRCSARHGQPHPVTGSRVILTVAHLDHQPENSDDGNLTAMCQRCHLAYDADHHRLVHKKTMRERKRNHELFDGS